MFAQFIILVMHFKLYYFIISQHISSLNVISAKKKEAYEDGEWEYFDRYMNINRGIYEALALVEKVGGMNG